jgi:hypothetical protein
MAGARRALADCLERCRLPRRRVQAQKWLRATSTRSWMLGPASATRAKPEKIRRQETCRHA